MSASKVPAGARLRTLIYPFFVVLCVAADPQPFGVRHNTINGKLIGWAFYPGVGHRYLSIGRYR